MYANDKFKILEERLNKAKDNHEAVIIQESNYGILDAVKVYIIYVGPRWATGEEVIINGDEEYHVKHTINYTSIVVGNKKQVKLIFEGGENV